MRVSRGVLKTRVFPKVTDSTNCPVLVPVIYGGVKDGREESVMRRFVLDSIRVSLDSVSCSLFPNCLIGRIGGKEVKISLMRRWVELTWSDVGVFNLAFNLFLFVFPSQVFALRMIQLRFFKVFGNLLIVDSLSSDAFFSRSWCEALFQERLGYPTSMRKKCSPSSPGAPSLHTISKGKWVWRVKNSSSPETLVQSGSKQGSPSRYSQSSGFCSSSVMGLDQSVDLIEGWGKGPDLIASSVFSVSTISGFGEERCRLDYQQMRGGEPVGGGDLRRGELRRGRSEQWVKKPALVDLLVQSMYLPACSFQLIGGGSSGGDELRISVRFSGSATPTVSTSCMEKVCSGISADFPLAESFPVPVLVSGNFKIFSDSVVAGTEVVLSSVSVGDKNFEYSVEEGTASRNQWGRVAPFNLLVDDGLDRLSSFPVVSESAGSHVARKLDSLTAGFLSESPSQLAVLSLKGTLKSVGYSVYDPAPDPVPGSDPDSGFSTSNIPTFFVPDFNGLDTSNSSVPGLCTSLMEGDFATISNASSPESGSCVSWKESSYLETLVLLSEESPLGLVPFSDCSVSSSGEKVAFSGGVSSISDPIDFSISVPPDSHLDSDFCGCFSDRKGRISVDRRFAEASTERAPISGKYSMEPVLMEALVPGEQGGGFDAVRRVVEFVSSGGSNSDDGMVPSAVFIEGGPLVRRRDKYVAVTGDANSDAGSLDMGVGSFDKGVGSYFYSSCLGSNTKFVKNMVMNWVRDGDWNTLTMREVLDRLFFVFGKDFRDRKAEVKKWMEATMRKVLWEKEKIRKRKKRLKKFRFLRKSRSEVFKQWLGGDEAKLFLSLRDAADSYEYFQYRACAYRKILALFAASSKVEGMRNLIKSVGWVSNEEIVDTVDGILNQL